MGYINSYLTDANTWLMHLWEKDIGPILGLRNLVFGISGVVMTFTAYAVLRVSE